MKGSAQRVSSFGVCDGSYRKTKMTLPSEAALIFFFHILDTLLKAQTQGYYEGTAGNSHWFISLWNIDGSDDDDGISF